MKFLIFNIMVLGCLGYLLMGKPNENFLQWASNTKEKISNVSKEDFLNKIKNAINSNEKKELNDNISIQNNLKKNELLEMVKLELDKYDKKLENTLETFLLKTEKDISVNKIEDEIVNKNQILNSSNNNLESKKTKFNQFMSKNERASALAELITDMELYGLEN
jgi:hypothetical protein